MISKEAPPSVSIVIPVLNQRIAATRLVRYLIKEDCNKCQVEIIVVDNGSTDGLVESLVELRDPRVVTIVERTRKSPYVCRNLGVEKAKGNYILLIDANCIPTSTGFLNELVYSIERLKADIVVGDFVFRFDKETPSLGELLDSILHLDAKAGARRGCVPGAMLMTKPEVFVRHGRFPEYLRSNGDTVWSKNVTDNGGTIGFAENVKILYKAKDARGVARKQLRVGYGNRQVLLSAGRSKPYLFVRSLVKMCPPKPSTIRQALETRASQVSYPYSFSRIYIYVCYLNFLRSMGGLGLKRFLHIKAD